MRNGINDRLGKPPWGVIDAPSNQWLCDGPCDVTVRRSASHSVNKGVGREMHLSSNVLMLPSRMHETTLADTERQGSQRATKLGGQIYFHLQRSQGGDARLMVGAARSPIVHNTPPVAGRDNMTASCALRLGLCGDTLKRIT